MTDFFSDLEREIRAAHPRRSRPVVPVKGIALSAAVAATLVAVVLGLGAITTGEREVAQPPQPPQEGWTEYAPLDCDGKVVDGRIPDELLDRFAILRGDMEPPEFPDGEVPSGIAEVIRQSLRRVEGPGSREYVFAVARLAEQDCTPGPPMPCLFSIQSESHVCSTEEHGEPAYLVEEFTKGRRIVAVFADDSVRRVSVSMDRRGVIAEFDLGNVGFEVIPGGDDDPRVTAEGEAIPLGCSTQPAMGPLKERFAIFRGPALEGYAFEAAMPEPYQRIYRNQSRRSDHPTGIRYMVFPAADPACGTVACIVREGWEKAACGAAEDDPVTHLVTHLGTDQYEVGALVGDGVREVKISYDAGDGSTETAVAVIRDNVAVASVKTERPESIEVEPFLK